MRKLIIAGPGGVGIKWLSNLIFSLEQDIIPRPSANGLNFHKTPGSEYVEVGHYEMYDSISAYFYGTAVFNIYLNELVKHVVPETGFEANTIETQFDDLASRACWKLKLLNSHPIDLDWNSLYTAPDYFIDVLFGNLDKYQVPCTKNYDSCMTAIDNYKATVIDSKLHLGNYNDKLWLGFCLGILKETKGQAPLVQSIEHAAELLYPMNDYFTEYTQRHII